MPRNILHIGAASRLALYDLEEIDRRLSGQGELNAQWMLIVKQALIVAANLADLEPSVRHLYKNRPALAAEFKNHEKAYGFAKYVRNILVGHVNDDLLAKAFEWKPELLQLLADNDDRTGFLINIFVLETALNTYVDQNENHLVFNGDTDLAYPPDWNRFLGFLEGVVRGGIAFSKLIVAAAQEDMPAPPEGDEHLLGYINAGRTTFARIKK
ncbi:hypothetical protein [Hyphococcus sp.]|uniref:hypothetical protein n=1 Tax=Hyphococcus sp. TaxID=2038636 RepID=UPI003D0A957A